MCVLLAKDCYLVGRQAYLEKDWHMSRDWMKEALNKFDESKRGFCMVWLLFVDVIIADSESSRSDVDLALVHEHLAFSEYQLGNIKKATQYTRDLLQNGKTHFVALFGLFLTMTIAEPNHKRALTNLAYFEGLRTNSTDKFTDAGTGNDSEEESYTYQREVYEATCREGRPMVSVCLPNKIVFACPHELF